MERYSKIFLTEINADEGGLLWCQDKQDEDDIEYMLVEDHLKAMVEQRKACDDAWWDNEGAGPATISRAILSANIEDKDNEI